MYFVRCAKGYVNGCADVDALGNTDWKVLWQQNEKQEVNDVAYTWSVHTLEIAGRFLFSYCIKKN